MLQILLNCTCATHLNSRTLPDPISMHLGISCMLFKTRILSGLIACLSVGLVCLSIATTGVGADLPATPWQRLSRAGQPHTVARWARGTNSPSYSGYYVGGGAAWHGEPRRCEEGTWGWDYAPGHALSPKVALGWWHGRKSQGGTGAYRTDGARFLPDRP